MDIPGGSIEDLSHVLNEYWEQFFLHIAVIHREIKKWETLSTPTPTDEDRKVQKLADLEDELQLFCKLKRLIFLDQHPVSNFRFMVPPIKAPTDTTVFVNLDEALELLDIEQHELAANLVPRDGKVFLRAFKEPRLGRFERFDFEQQMGCDYKAHMEECLFIRDEVVAFVPERFITGSELLKFWRRTLKEETENFIVERVRENQLRDIHPTQGATSATSPDYPPLAEGLFAITEIRACQEAVLRLRCPIGASKTSGDRNKLILAMFEIEETKKSRGAAIRVGKIFNLKRQRINAIVKAEKAKRGDLPLLRFADETTKS